MRFLGGVLCIMITVGLAYGNIAGQQTNRSDIRLSINSQTNLLYAWLMPDQTIIAYDRTMNRLIRINNKGQLLESASLGSQSAGPYQMRTVTGGFVEGDTVWVSGVIPKLIQWNLHLKPLKAITIPKVYYIWSLIKQDQSLWIGGDMPQKFFLTPGWHLFKFSWPSLNLQYKGLGTPKKLIELEEKFQVGGMKLITTPAKDIIYMVSHIYPLLFEYHLKTKVTRVYPLKFWRNIWAQPRKYETPVVYALNVIPFKEGYVGVQIFDHRKHRRHYVLEVVDIKANKDFTVDLPGRWLGMIQHGQWLFQMWKKEETFLGWRKVTIPGGEK